MHGRCTRQREQPGNSNIAIFGLFLKQLVYSRLLDIRLQIANSARIYSNPIKL